MQATNALVMRRAVERLLQPFRQAKRGCDLGAYGFRETFSRVRTPDMDFTCQVNGKAGNAKLLEDFFLVLLCGFDITRVELDQKALNRTTTIVDGRVSTVGTVSKDPFAVSGCFHLTHSRPFLGWQPSAAAIADCDAHHSMQASIPMSMQQGSVSEERTLMSESLNNAIADAKSVFPDAQPLVSMQPRMRYPTAHAQMQEQSLGQQELSVAAASPEVILPFTSHVEGYDHRISHMVFRSPAIEVITSIPGCPQGVHDCLQDQDALKMLITLRRAGVNPSMITERALRSVSRKTETWASALGIM